MAPTTVTVTPSPPNSPNWLTALRIPENEAIKVFEKIYLPVTVMTWVKAPADAPPVGLISYSLKDKEGRTFTVNFGISSEPGVGSPGSDTVNVNAGVTGTWTFVAFTLGPTRGDLFYSQINQGHHTKISYEFRSPEQKKLAKMHTLTLFHNISTPFPYEITQFSFPALAAGFSKTDFENYKNGAPPSKPFLWLPMNEGTGSKLWDHSGNNNHVNLNPSDSKWNWATTTVTLQVTKAPTVHVFPTELDVYTGDKVEWLFPAYSKRSKIATKKILKGPHDVDADEFFSKRHLSSKSPIDELSGIVKAKAGEHFKYSIYFAESGEIDPTLKCLGSQTLSRRGGSG